MSKRKLTTKKEEQRKEAQRRGVERLINDEEFSDISIDFARSKFILYQMEKGNSKQTIAFYERFFKKFYAFLETNHLRAGNVIVSVKRERATLVNTLADLLFHVKGEPVWRMMHHHQGQVRVGRLGKLIKRSWRKIMQSIVVFAGKGGGVDQVCFYAIAAAEMKDLPRENLVLFPLKTAHVETTVLV